MALPKFPNAQIVALCDVDENVLNQRLADVEKSHPKPKPYTDFRKLLEDKSIDAVSIATPNHWHSLMAIWACQAGKDVYVEKPCSHNIFEGRRSSPPPASTTASCQHGSQMPLLRRPAGSHQEDARRHHRRRLPRARPLLQVARHDRPHAGRAVPPASTTISGPVPPP